MDYTNDKYELIGRRLCWIIQHSDGDADFNIRLGNLISQIDAEIRLCE